MQDKPRRNTQDLGNRRTATQTTHSIRVHAIPYISLKSVNRPDLVFQSTLRYTIDELLDDISTTNKNYLFPRDSFVIHFHPEDNYNQTYTPKGKLKICQLK